MRQLWAFLQHVYFFPGRDTQSFRLFPQHVTTTVAPTYLGKFKVGMVILRTTPTPWGREIQFIIR